MLFPNLDNPRSSRHLYRRGNGFTLIELLVTVAVLGIAAALVVPSMNSTNGLRVQAAVRTVIADIAFAQSDAMAYQSRRAIQFNKVARASSTSSYTYVTGNGYTLAEPTGSVLDLTASAMFDPSQPTKPLSRNFDTDNFGGATISSVNISGGSLLVFDELGGPVTTLTGNDPASGTIDITAVGESFRISIAPYTGLVTVARQAVASGEGEETTGGGTTP
jgi:prepilin-type N-terminal cleavage/methylation domain-containing protein